MGDPRNTGLFREVGCRGPASIQGGYKVALVPELYPGGGAATLLLQWGGWGVPCGQQAEAARPSL